MPGGRPKKPDDLHFHIHSIRFSDSLWRRLATAAKAKRQSRAAFIRALIERALADPAADPAREPPAS